MLEVCNLKKSFQEKSVLKDVSFTVDEGEIVCLLGNNGAGKTTIINCILKMIKPDDGKIIFQGNNILSISNKQYFTQVSALLESSENIYDYLTGKQNMEYFAGLMNIDRSQWNKAETYIDVFELREAINNPAGDYSRGMQQKLALIIALMASPKLLLLDEPTLGLDIKSKLSVIELLNRVVKEEKIGVILTTHQMDVVQKLNSKILILKEGTVRDFAIDTHNSCGDIYEVSYWDHGAVVQEEVEGEFKEIYARFSDKDIIEIKKEEQEIEKVIMEALDESN